jgi:hypothetical protein
MEFQGGGDQENPRRFLSDDTAREIAQTLEVSGGQVFAHTHPIVERLKRQVQVPSCLEFDDYEAAGVVDTEEIDYPALGPAEDRDLSVDGCGTDRSLDDLGMCTNLRLEPTFRIQAIKGMLAIRRVRAANASDFASGGFDGGEAGAAPAPYPAGQFAGRGACKFEAANLKADRAVGPLNPVYICNFRYRWNAGVRRNRAVARRQDGIDVAGVIEIDETSAIPLIERE